MILPIYGRRDALRNAKLGKQLDYFGFAPIQFGVKAHFQFTIF